MTGDQPQRGVPAPQGTRVDLDLFSETMDEPTARSGTGQPSAGNTSGRVRDASTSTLDIFLRKTTRGPGRRGCFTNCAAR